jgi:hypothetical protein
MLEMGLKCINVKITTAIIGGWWLREGKEGNLLAAEMRIQIENSQS